MKKYLKIALVFIAVFVIAFLLTLVVRVIREIVVSGASALHALGDVEVTEEEEDIPAVSAPVYGGTEGHLDPDAESVPGTVYGNVVYGTEDMDLFEVPVDVEADMLSP